jgi:hypothetical protein
MFPNKTAETVVEATPNRTSRRELDVAESLLLLAEATIVDVGFICVQADTRLADANNSRVDAKKRIILE